MDASGPDAQKVVFLFSSQGGQWPGMGQLLFKDEPLFRQTFERCDAEVQRCLGWSLVDRMVKNTARSRAPLESKYVQPANTALQIALNALLRSRGIAPAAITGLSMGEAAAAQAAGILDVEEAVQIACCCSRLTAYENKYYGRAAHVHLGPHDMGNYLRGKEDRVFIAAELSPETTVISGEGTAIERLIVEFQQRGIRSGLAPITMAYHGPEVAPLQNEFVTALRGLQPKPGSLPFYSSVTSNVQPGREMTAQYWWRIIGEPALFTQLTRNLFRTGHHVFAEIAPHGILAGSIRETARNSPVRISTVSVMGRNGDEREVFKDAAAKLCHSGLSSATTPVAQTQPKPQPAFGRLRMVLRQTLSFILPRPKPTLAQLIFTPQGRQNPYPLYRRLRNESPVCGGGPFGATLVSRYGDVHFVLKNPDIFSSSILQAIDSVLLGADPPRHERVRRILRRAFSPQWMLSLESRIQGICGELIDQMIRRRDCDVVRDLATALPMHLTRDFLALEPGEAPELNRWVGALTAKVTGLGAPDERAKHAGNEAELDKFLVNMIEARAQVPGDDLVSLLVHGQDGDDRLTGDEVRRLVKLLILAGNETTANLIGNAMLALLRHPDELEKVRAAPSLVPNVVEETLRYDAPVQMLPRRTTREVQLSEVTLGPGSTVFILIGSANRDERQYSDPDRFDIHRKAESHLAFGTGIHHCIGAMLARQEATIALQSLLSKTKTLHAAESLDAIPPINSMQVRGPSHLRCTVTA